MKTSKLTNPLKLVSALALSLIIVGCQGTRTNHNSSSVVDYLYPNEKPVVKPSIPVLSLPLDVGIAFVPAKNRHQDTITEADKLALMKKISAQFEERPFVKSIQTIPSPYLTPQGSFANLDQIKTMYGVDVIALVSYDQTQFTDDSVMSLAYWTLVGAYVVPGEKNDTHTMIDVAVYDIASRKMLFRAPGTNYIKSVTTPVNLEEKLRKDSMKGFQAASDAVIPNLDLQLNEFMERVKSTPTEYKVVHKPGYSGGGSLEWLSLAFVAAFAGAWSWTRRPGKS